MTFFTLLQLNKRLLRNSRLARAQKIVALVGLMLVLPLMLVFLDSVTVSLMNLLTLNLAYDVAKTKGNQLMDMTHFAVFPVSLSRKLWWLFLTDLISLKTVLSLVWVIGCCFFTTYSNPYFILLAALLLVAYNLLALVLAFETVRIKGFTFVNILAFSLLNFISLKVLNPHHFGRHPFDPYLEQYPASVAGALAAIVVLLLLGTRLYVQFRLTRNPFYSPYIKDTYNTDFWH
jgi:hypothetical protein